MTLSTALTTSSMSSTDSVGCTMSIKDVSPNSFATGNLFS